MAVQEFASVYAEHLPTVWRYVRRRIPDTTEAEDVTGEVFVRAFEGWTRFDPDRSALGAWLSGIARHTVADWWRKRGSPEEPAADLADAAAQTPDVELADRELLGSLSAAFRALDERERDALALRFAANLRAAEVAAILGLSLGATKMLLFRTLRKLRDSLAAQTAGGAIELEAADLLDRAIDDVLARRRTSIPDVLMERLVHLMVALHQPAAPADLAEKVQACLACLTEEETTQARGARERVRRALQRVARLTLPGWAVLGGCAVGVCAAYAPANFLGTVLHATGLTSAAIGLHLALPVIAPINGFALWLGYQRHHRPAALVVGGIGIVLVLAHVSSHFLPADFSGAHRELTGALNWLSAPAALVLVAGLLMDWWFQWTSRRTAISRALGTA